MKIQRSHISQKTIRIIILISLSLTILTLHCIYEFDKTLLGFASTLYLLIAFPLLFFLIKDMRDQ